MTGTPGPSSPAEDNGVPPTANHTGAIIGGVIGASALAVVAGAMLYRHRKRKQREEESEKDDLWHKYQEEDDAPPVSALWLSGGMKRMATTNSKVGEGRLGRFFGMGAKPSPTLSQVVPSLPPTWSGFHNLAAERAAQSPPAISPRSVSPTRLDLLPTAAGEHGERLSRRSLERLRREPSKESLASTGGASHLSYPFLTGMHRRSLVNLSLTSTAGERTATPSAYTTDGSAFNTPAALKYGRSHSVPESPRQFSIARKPVPALVTDTPNPFAETPNPFADTPLPEDDAASHMAQRAGGPSPLFPWESKMTPSPLSKLVSAFPRPSKMATVQRMPTIFAGSNGSGSPTSNETHASQFTSSIGTYTTSGNGSDSSQQASRETSIKTAATIAEPLQPGSSAADYYRQQDRMREGKEQHGQRRRHRRRPAQLSSRRVSKEKSLRSVLTVTNNEPVPSSQTAPQ